MLKLTYFPGTISIAAALTLEEAGLAYDPVRVDFATDEQTKPDYHAINPKGRVPALITDAGTLTETGAILEYIAATAPDAGLIPEDPFQAGQMREAMYYLASTMHVNHAHKMRGHRWANEETSWEDMTAKVPHTMRESAAYVEAHILSDADFVCGDAISLADCYLYIVCLWLPGDQVDLTPFPRIRAFMDRMGARASVAALKEKGMLPA